MQHPPSPLGGIKGRAALPAFWLRRAEEVLKLNFKEFIDYLIKIRHLVSPNCTDSTATDGQRGFTEEKIYSDRKLLKKSYKKPT